MADFVTRHTPSHIDTGIKTAARMNQAEEMVQIPWLYQLCLEGRVFVAGHGLAETEVDGEAAIDDTTPTLLLHAPSAGTIVLPLYMRIYFDSEGAGTPILLWNYMQADFVSGASGTALTPLNCLGGVSPRKPQATCLHSVSAVSAPGNDGNAVIHERSHLLDNLISVEAVTTVGDIERWDTSTFEFTWQPEMPLPLRAYSAVAFYAGTTTDSKFNFTIAWAELDEDTYKV